MADKATDRQLKQGFLTHLDETNTHVQRLEQVFQMHGVEVKAVDCPAIDGSSRRRMKLPAKSPTSRYWMRP